MVFRWGIFLLACIFLYVRLAGPKGIVATGGPALLHELRANASVLLAMALLMIVNWLLEAMKWRQLLRGVEHVPLGRAFKATIAGTSVGFVSLNRTGEFLGRVLFLEPANRVAGGFATALGSMAQFVVTLTAGGFGLLLLTLFRLPLPWHAGWISWAVATLTTLVALMALVLYLYPGLLRQLLLLLPFLHRFEQASGVLSRYQRSDLLNVLFLSMARYMVFGFQFVLLLRTFDAGMGTFEAVLAIPLIYLIATLIPSVMLTELGVRGSVAMAVLAPLGAHDGLVLMATTCLWVINVALPASVGSSILLFARIRSRHTG
ncbi:MAG: flippase-like domain-containing protein [Flavobacteriales bacterium]|nr:flippase-like domain-containing protein [Flavobacteriales bacterium]